MLTFYSCTYFMFIKVKYFSSENLLNYLKSRSIISIINIFTCENVLCNYVRSDCVFVRKERTRMEV